MDDNVKKLIDKLVETVEAHTKSSPPKELMPMHYMMLAKAELIITDYRNGKIPEKDIKGILRSAIKAFGDYQEMASNFDQTLVVKFAMNPDTEEGTLTIASGEKDEPTIKKMMYKMYAALTAYVESLSPEEIALYKDEEPPKVATIKNTLPLCEPPRREDFLKAIDNISNEHAREYAQSIYEDIYEYIPEPDSLDESVLNSIIDRCSKVLDSSDVAEVKEDTQKLKSILKKSLSI